VLYCYGGQGIPEEEQKWRLRPRGRAAGLQRIQLVDLDLFTFPRVSYEREEILLGVGCNPVYKGLNSLKE
jgi:hypothetical protein